MQVDTGVPCFPGGSPGQRGGLLGEWEYPEGADPLRQVLVWGPNNAWTLIEDPDARPYVWDLPDG